LNPGSPMSNFCCKLQIRRESSSPNFMPYTAGNELFSCIRADRTETEKWLVPIWSKSGPIPFLWKRTGPPDGKVSKIFK
jgi:hypothetical protein